MSVSRKARAAFFAYYSEGQADGYERFGEVKGDRVLRKGGFCQRERERERECRRLANFYTKKKN